MARPSGQELYFSNVPFMDSISFSFLLYAAYCVALCLVLPIRPSPASTHPMLKPLHLDVAARTSWSVFLLTAFLFAFIDMVIDPVALRGDRWFLGKIYYYPDPGMHFGVPFANYVGMGRRRAHLPRHLFSTRATTPRALASLHRSHLNSC